MTRDISLFNGAAWYVAFLFSTVLHEASHAFAALKLGDDTAHRSGQVTLDPVPHIKREPVGMVIVPLLSYFMGGWMVGWASAPYDPHWANRYPKRAGIMAMAGPASNFLLLLLAAILIRLGMLAGYFNAPHTIRFDHVVEATATGLPTLCAILLSIGFSLNLILFLFNLIPFPPLDGSSAPLLFLSEEAAVKYWELLRNPGFTLLGFVLAWNLFNAVFPPLHLLAINLLYFESHYV